MTLRIRILVILTLGALAITATKVGQDRREDDQKKRLNEMDEALHGGRVDKLRGGKKGLTPGVIDTVESPSNPIPRLHLE